MLIDARGIPSKRWPALLERLVRESVRERQRGTPALENTSVIYQREPDRHEIWQTAQATLERGHGDCEDLAIWLAADVRIAGFNAKVIVKPIRAGLQHALVLAGHGLRQGLIDPSLARGMKGPG
jgi:transglutaminase-like putative cysteine protease